MNKKKIVPVSIIIPMRNSETTILETLKSLRKQTYPIAEIIIVDNVSSDNSVAVVGDYKKKFTNTPIYLLVNTKNRGVGGSYNRGVSKSTSNLVVLMHSDSTLRTTNELAKLVAPITKDKNVVATYSSIVLPRRVWVTYNFWQKLLSVRAVDKKQPGLNGKFDCISKKIYQDIGGFNITQYGHHIDVGADDADLHLRLARKGKVVEAKSEVIHLHYLGPKYSLLDLFDNRRLLARSYGRLLRLENIKLGFAALVFFIKPILVLLLVLPFMFPLNLILLLSYVFWYYSKMYVTRETLLNPRILLLPIVTVLLTLLEVYWMLKAFLFLNKSNV
ncbi:MAG: glycosyltransferase family 2 protein [Candidatus Levybacteria bacterium]|nr:glycosyltransferase family 2 protein [Candidatus Levybacteria bacterium]